MYKYHQNLMCSSSYTCSGYCYEHAQNESGRSMVEMLGVLAIAGVLTIGGFAGYNMAMDKHRANEIIDGANKRAVIISAQAMNGNELTVEEFGDEKVAGADMDVLDFADGGFAITVSQMSNRVCKNVLNSIGEKTTIRYMALKDSPETEINECSEDETAYALIYNNDLSAVDYVFDGDDDDDSGLPPLSSTNCSNSTGCNYGCDLDGNCATSGCLGSYYSDGTSSYYCPAGCDYFGCASACEDHVFYDASGRSSGPCDTCVGTVWYGWASSEAPAATCMSMLSGCYGGYYYDGMGSSTGCILGCEGNYQCVTGCIDSAGNFQQYNGVTTYDSYCDSSSSSGCYGGYYYNGMGSSTYCPFGCNNYYCNTGCSGSYFCSDDGYCFSDYYNSYGCNSMTYPACSSGVFYSDSYYSSWCPLGCDGSYCRSGCSGSDYYDSYGSSMSMASTCGWGCSNNYFSNGSSSIYCPLGCESYYGCNTGCTNGVFYSYFDSYGNYFGTYACPLGCDGSYCRSGCSGSYSCDNYGWCYESTDACP